MILTQNHGFISVARMPKGTVINGKSVGGNFVQMKHIGIFNAKPIVSELIAKEKDIMKMPLKEIEYLFNQIMAI